MTHKLSAQAAIIALILLFTHCSPKDKNNTTVEPEKPSNTFLLLGTWDVVFMAWDDNENGQLDEDEKEFPEEDDEMLSILFKSDGTGETIISFEDIPGVPEEEREPFKWEFLNNETQLGIVTEYTDSFNTYRDTSVMDILALSDVSLNLREHYTYFNGVDSSSEMNWTVLQKKK